MFPQVSLTAPTRGDVERLAGWLTDDEVNTSWYGLGDDGQPLHAGYVPSHVLEGDDNDWDRVFNDDNRKVFAVYSSEGEHIGEAQLVIEWPLLEAQAFILVGAQRPVAPPLWHNFAGQPAGPCLQRLGSASHLGRCAGSTNRPALDMVEHIGFVVEGHFRKAHRRGDQWFDSYALGLLAEEYPRRRARLMETNV